MVYTETYTVVYIHVFFDIKLVCCLGIVWIRATRQTQSWYITWYILCYLASYISCYLAWYRSCYLAWYTPNHTLRASSTFIPGTSPGVGIGRSRNNAISAASIRIYSQDSAASTRIYSQDCVYLDSRVHRANWQQVAAFSAAAKTHTVITARAVQRLW